MAAGSAWMATNKSKQALMGPEAGCQTSSGAAVLQNSRVLTTYITCSTHTHTHMQLQLLCASPLNAHLVPALLSLLCCLLLVVLRRVAAAKEACCELHQPCTPSRCKQVLRDKIKRRGRFNGAAGQQDRSALL